MKEDRSVTISCYHSYVIQNRTEFLSHSDLTHLILISWNFGLISSHLTKFSSHLISSHQNFCLISSHLKEISSHSGLMPGWDGTEMGYFSSGGQPSLI